MNYYLTLITVGGGEALFDLVRVELAGEGGELVEEGAAVEAGRPLGRSLVSDGGQVGRWGKAGALPLQRAALPRRKTSVRALSAVVGRQLGILRRIGRGVADSSGISARCFSLLRW